MIETRFNRIPCCYTKNLGPMFYYMCLNTGAKITMEVGVADGYVSALLTYAMYMNKGAHIAIDIDPVRIEKVKQTAKVMNYSGALRAFACNSLEFDYIKEPKIDFIFLDSSHEYEQTCNEIDKFTKLLSPNGIMAIHDCTYIPDVANACKKKLSSRHWEKIVIEDKERKTEGGNGTLIIKRK